MPDIKISELTPAETAHPDDRLETSQVESAGFVSKSITLDQVSSVVANSDQVHDVIDDAIALLPPPVSDWDSITGKPATFPPTVPIAYSDISGKPSTFPPSTHSHPESDVTNLVADLALKAPLASPVFTGDPQAPTPATADNDTSVATTAYVKANIAAIPAPPPSTTVSATAPVSPVDGQLWFFTDASVGGGNLYIRYNDGSSTAWVPASTATAGSVVQTVYTQTGAVATGTTVIPLDDTIPQITEGNEYMTLAITPRSATSRLIIDVVWNGSNSAAVGAIVVALFQDSTASALAVVAPVFRTSTDILNVKLTHTMASGTTSATTFRVRAGCSGAGTTTFNGQAGGRQLGSAMASSIVIQEVL